MADTERPKRLRGAKLLEEGYRAGFADGLRHAIAEIEARQGLDYTRETTILSGLAHLRSQKANVPKRTRRAKATRSDEQKLRDLAQERAS